jgi:tryptophan synthase beta chain
MTLASAPGRARVAGSSGRDRPGGVVADIAARRAADIAVELEGTTLAELARRAEVALPPRPVAEALAASGCHLIAEVKRSSPSAGRIARADDDPVRRARAYASGGASMISVLCEPHWFSGSVEDLRAVRSAVSVPVLAKDFIVDERQLAVLRAAGADAVLLLAVLHPARRLAAFVAAARDLGLEPLVEVHEVRELDRALASGARLVGVNTRDLRTLTVDPDRAIRLRPSIPDDRIAIAESGVRDPATIAAWRAAGYDAALVGEALMRSPDPAAAARAFVSAGSVPVDPAAADRAPFVKICGVTDADGVLAVVRSGADAIGINLVPGTPRCVSLETAASLSRLARASAPATRAPRVVLVTADMDRADLAAAIAATEPDAVQLSGSEPSEAIRAVGRPAWKVIHLPADDLGAAAISGDAAISGGSAARDVDVDAVVARVRACLAAGAERVLLDTAGGPHPGGTGVRVSTTLAGAVAREVPVTLAGGMTPANVGSALRSMPVVGIDVASGVEAPRASGAALRKDPLRVALLVKRAKGARHDLPHVASRPTPVPAGLLEADDRGRWGIDRAFGGRYVPETLVAALEQLERAYAAIRHDPVFWSELRALLGTYSGRPTPIYRADRLAESLIARARALAPGTGADLPDGIRLYLKREDLAHTGAHKINNALGQALLTRRLGKSRVIAETGAGQHGVATATACALLEIPCVVYMGAEDIERQQPNVARMHALGAEVRPVTSGTATLKDAVNDAMRDWVTNVETTHYVLGSAMGPHPYPTIVRDLQRVIGDEAAPQVVAAEGRLPDLAIACVGGGSNAIGLLSRFIGEPEVRLAVAEAAGDGIPTGRHAAALIGGSAGILHGARSLMLQDRDGQVVEAHSLSAGLDYPGVGPQIAALFAAGRLEVEAATDAEAVAAVYEMTLTEGILPALETAHAVAVLPRLIAGTGSFGRPLPDHAVVLLGLSGRGDKDLAALERWEARRAEAGR